MGNEIRREVGLRIAQLREARGLSQRQLSDELEKIGLKVRRETVTQWEAGTRDLKTEYTVKLADFFGVTCDEILRGIKAENLSVSQKTGLSDKAIETLSRWQGENNNIPAFAYIKNQYIGFTQCLNFLIESKEVYEFFNNIIFYLIYSDIVTKEPSKKIQPDLTADEHKRFYAWADERGLDIVKQTKVRDMYMQSACDSLKTICKEMVEKWLTYKNAGTKTEN